MPQRRVKILDASSPAYKGLLRARLAVLGLTPAQRNPSPGTKADFDQETLTRVFESFGFSAEDCAQTVYLEVTRWGRGEG